MATRKGIERPPSWRPMSKLTSTIQLHLCGSIYILDKYLIALKSSKMSNLLQNNPDDDDFSHLLRDMPADHESMELLVKFCHGYDVSLSTQNVVRVACLAHYLGMTEAHFKNNLFTAAVAFFEQQVVTSWTNSIKALKTAETLLQQALHLGLVDYCIDSIVQKVLENPRLLGEPIQSFSSTDDDDDSDDGYLPNARRNLFDVDWKSEDLTFLSVKLYAPIIHKMSQRRIPHEYLAGNILRYAKAWLFDTAGDGESNMPAHEMNARREIVEALTALLPDTDTATSTIFPCPFLSEMLRLAIALEAHSECRSELELKIGKQLDRATVNDLLIPSRGYAKEEKYDTECVRRILKHFYCSYAAPDPGPLNSVSELVDEFLAEVSTDIDLKPTTFLEIAEMSVAAGGGMDRTSDGVYRAVDVYLEKHGYLIETEREKVCGVLDCNRLSAEACEHAARNERLPVRVVVQVLFVSQMKLREAVPKAEMEKMGSKVMELEKECDEMKREMIRGAGGGGDVRRRRTTTATKKKSVWREVKRKFGCGSTSIQQQQHDCNCHVKMKKAKKVHPK